MSTVPPPTPPPPPTPHTHPRAHHITSYLATIWTGSSLSSCSSFHPLNEETKEYGKQSENSQRWAKKSIQHFFRARASRSVYNMIWVQKTNPYPIQTLILTLIITLTLMVTQKSNPNINLNIDGHLETYR